MTNTDLCSPVIPEWMTTILCQPISHRVGGNRKHFQQLMNADQKWIETVFLIAICRQCGDKWQLKTLFISIFDLRSSIVMAFSIAAYPVCIWARQSRWMDEIRFYVNLI